MHKSGIINGAVLSGGYIEKITEAVAFAASHTGLHPYEVADNFCANIADAEIRNKLSSDIRHALRKNAHQYPWNL